MKHSLRFALLIAILGLLLAGCERPDLKLQQKLVGTWTREKFFEMTLTPEGKCESKFVGKDWDVTLTGNWLVSNGGLVVTVTGKRDRNLTNSTVSIGDIEHFRIVSLDAVRLVMAADGQTNTYHRK